MKIFLWFIALCGAFVTYSGLAMADSIELHWSSLESWFCFLLTCIGVLSFGASLLGLSELKRLSKKKKNKLFGNILILYTFPVYHLTN